MRCMGHSSSLCGSIFGNLFDLQCTMAGSYSFQAAGAGLRNTLRFPSAEEGFGIGDRDWFVRKVVIGALGLDPAEVFCLQFNLAEGGYELSITRDDRFRTVESLCRTSMKVITVLLYNPYVGDATVTGFLAKYGKVDPLVRYLRDGYGIWAARRQFRVLLADDSDGAEVLKHPPAYFNIGAERGFLFYNGQLPFCRKCCVFGHMAVGCAQLRCRNCGGKEHGAASCKVPKKCHH